MPRRTSRLGDKREKTSDRRRSHPDDADFMHRLNADPMVAQSYETLLSSLHLLDSTGSLKTVLVTSAQPEEGKTTVTLNLALTIVLAGKKPLVLDADLRKPRIHQVLGLENNQGTADILTGKLEPEETIQVVDAWGGESPSPATFSVITSGHVSPGFFDATALTRLRQPLDRLRGRYDLVLLDSPPTLAVNDALHLAPLVDGVVLVLNAGMVLEKNALSTKERLEQAGGRILGVVLNRFDEESSGPPLNPYYAYYRPSDG